MVISIESQEIINRFKKVCLEVNGESLCSNIGPTLCRCEYYQEIEGAKNILSCKFCVNEDPRNLKFSILKIS